MSWPQSIDYSAAVQNPAWGFADPDLKGGQAAAGPLGLPLTYAGNFASVYRVDCPGGDSWAVKCFTREAPDRQERYQRISQHLQSQARRFTVEFRFLDQGVHVQVDRPVMYRVCDVPAALRLLQSEASGEFTTFLVEIRRHEVGIGVRQESYRAIPEGKVGAARVPTPEVRVVAEAGVVAGAEVSKRRARSA